jgi:hypothetical protein
MPVLNIGEKHYDNVIPALLLLGKKNGYYPEDPKVAYECDVVMELTEEIFE